MKRIFELAAEHRGLLLISGVLAAFAAAASLIPYVFVYLIIRHLIEIYPDMGGIDTKLLLGYGGLAILFAAADALCFLLSSICAHLAAFGTQYNLKRGFAKHLAKIPLGFHLNIGSGRFRKVMNQDIEKMESFLAHVYPDMVSSFVAPIALLIILFVFDWRFGLASLAAVMIAFAIQFAAMGVSGSELMEKLQKNEADMTEATVEYVRGMPVLKAFGQTAHSFKQFCGSIKKYTEFMLAYTMKWKNSTALFMAKINNIYLFLIPLGIVIGSRSKNYRHFLLNFMFYLVFAPAIASVLHKFMYVSSSSMRVSGGVRSYDAMMALPRMPEGKNDKAPKSNALVFDKVSFSYEGNDSLALSDLSFTAPEGKITAIVGPSGGGKSTIAHLIPRFWDVSSGSISIGGVDIRDMAEEELMRRVSFVFQDVYLFSRSIRDNIRMGCPNAGDEEVIRAAKAAMCDDFIRKLPKGYDTVIGKEGVHLSGGEAQRIAIARAIMKNAPVLVLDEATAFADSENERKIQIALSKLSRGKTLIIIAHRLGTIKSADQILVMEGGRLAESGTHAELLEKNFLYAGMWTRYQETIKWGIGRKEEEA